MTEPARSPGDRVELYAVRMDVALPPGMDPAVRAARLARAEAYAPPGQRYGRWRHRGGGGWAGPPGGGLGGGAAPDLLAREKAYAQQWQRSGHWRHLWRCVGEYANLSIFAVEGNTALHEILWGLPLFPYMTLAVTPLAPHPSTLDAS